MKILCIGYYDKFSRFFLGIRKELKKEFPKLDFKIFNLYFSGFFYGFLRNVPSALFSFRAWKNVFFNKRKYLKIIEKHTHYRTISLENLVFPYCQLNKSLSKRQLLLQAVSYIDLVEKELVSNRPDLILLIGDSRMLIEITKKLAREHGVKTYYIEQGPFGTTVFDRKGVNANASIRDFQFENKETGSDWGTIELFMNRNFPRKYIRSPFYRGMDYLLGYILENTKFYPPDLKIPELFFKKYDLCEDDRFKKFPKRAYQQGKPIFLLICQVPFDVNLSHHSPFFKSHSELLERVFESLPPKSMLVVREHPLYRGKYEDRFYELLLTEQIFVDCGQNLHASLEYANVVIVNNSTVGLEAIAKHKPVVVLGNSYYDLPPLCLKCTTAEKLGELLQKSLSFKPSRPKSLTFLHAYFFEHLIKGHLTDRNLGAASAIAKKIIHLQNEKIT